MTSVVLVAEEFDRESGLGGASRLLDHHWFVVGLLLRYHPPDVAVDPFVHTTGTF